MIHDDHDAMCHPMSICFTLDLHGIHDFHALGLPPTPDSSHKCRFSSGFPSLSKQDPHLQWFFLVPLLGGIGDI